MIRAVIFDCFGVLASEAWIPFRNKHFGSDPAALNQANTLMRQLGKAQLAYNKFLSAIAEMAGVERGVVQERMQANVPNKDLFEYMQTLKGRYKIAMLSNTGENRLSTIFSPEQLQLFDVLALSYEIGYIKPSKEAYLHVAKLLHVKPEECVFVDDQEHYLEGARKVGMQTVLFQNAQQCAGDLERLLSQREA